MLKQFEIWLLEQNYTATTAEDYQGRIERLCRKEDFSLSYLIDNIVSLLPLFEKTGAKASYGKRSHNSVINSLRHFQKFLSTINS